MGGGKSATRDAKRNTLNKMIYNIFIHCLLLELDYYRESVRDLDLNQVQFISLHVICSIIVHPVVIHSDVRWERGVNPEGRLKLFSNRSTFV